MIFTLSHAKSFCAKFVGDGKDSEDDAVVDAINECSMIFMDEANWKHTVRKMWFGVVNYTFALPHDVDQILKVNFCYSPANVWSMGYEFLDGGVGTLLSGNTIPQQDDIVDLGDGWATMFPVGAEAVEDLDPRELKICAFCTEAADENKTLRVRGVNGTSTPINPTGPGELLTIHRWDGGVEGQLTQQIIDSALSTNSFREITSVVKPETSGFVNLYAYNPDYEEDEDRNSMFHFLAKYHPYETYPSYRRYRITASGTSTIKHITALAKMRYVPLRHDSDVLPIQSLPAYKLMCKSLHQFDHGDAKQGMIYKAAALRILDRQLSNNNQTQDTLDVDADFGFGDIPEII